MPSAFHRHYEIIARLSIIHRQLVIFVCDFPQAALDPLEGNIAIFCADTNSLYDFHNTMLTDRSLGCALSPPELGHQQIK